MTKSTDALPADEVLGMLRDASDDVEKAHRRKVDAVAEARIAGLKWDQICEAAGISRPTAIRYAREAGEVVA